MASMADTALVIMARYPQEGKTKTRLARRLGEQATLTLYKAFLTDLAQRFAGQSCTLHWAYTPEESDYRAFVTNLAPTHEHTMQYFPQKGPDLGARLHHAFQWTAQRGFERTIVLGSDSPQISSAIVQTARAALDYADVVLGPSDDGGYYLIAMRQPHDVFSGIPMSTDVVTQMTIDRAKQLGLSVQLLESLFDVDEFADLQRLAQLLAAEPELAPVTAAHLETMRSMFDDHDNTHTHTATLNLYRADEPL